MPARLNPDASSSRKMLELYSLLLFSGRRYTLTALAERMQCSKTTIERLVSEIEIFDEVQLGKDGRERWFQINRLSKNRKVQIMHEQIQQLALCKDFVSCILPEEIKAEIEKTVSHAAGFIADDKIKELSLQPIARGAAKGVIDYTPFQGILITIMQAIPKKIICDVTYASPKSKSTKKFIIAPMRLLLYHNAIHAECWRFKREGDRQFLQPITLAVHRIECLNPTKKKHKINDLPDNINGNFGLIKSETLEIKVLFDKDVACYISERKWSSDQTITALSSGAIELTCTVNSMEEALAWILSFGEKAEVIGPAHFRDAISAALASSLKKYQLGS